MKHRLHSKWLSYRDTPIYCIDFSGCGADRESVQMEIAAAEATIAKQPANSMLVTLDLSLTDFTPDVAAFLNRHALQARDPIRKMGILGIRPWQRRWYAWTRRVTWPNVAAFFPEYELAKAWIVSEEF